MDVYETFSDGLRELSPPAFARFIDTSMSPLTEEGQCSLLKNILRHYLPNAAPDPQKVDPEAAESDGASLPMLEKCFLPFAANTLMLDANTKMALVLENLFRLVWERGGIAWSESLQAAVVKGVEARNDRVKRKAARTRPDSDESSLRDIVNSGQRLLTLMSLIKFDSGDSRE